MTAPDAPVLSPGHSSRPRETPSRIGSPRGLRAPWGSLIDLVPGQAGHLAVVEVGELRHFDEVCADPISDDRCRVSVSYTHLTLPTILLV